MDDLIYNFILKDHHYGPIMRNSASGIYIFQSLKHIFHSRDDLLCNMTHNKNWMLQNNTFKCPSSILLTKKNFLDAGIEMLNVGSHALVMCCSKIDVVDSKVLKNQDEKLEDIATSGDATVEQFTKRDLVMEISQEKALKTRTTALYPIRSQKYQKIMASFTSHASKHLQCISTFLPQIIVVKDDHLRLKPQVEWRILSLVVIPSILRNEDNKSMNVHDGMNLSDERLLVKAKLNCVFDVAIRQRSPGLLDSIILTDLGCTSLLLVEYYCDAVEELLKTYMFNFRNIVLAIDTNDVLYNALKCRLELMFQSPIASQMLW